MAIVDSVPISLDTSTAKPLDPYISLPWKSEYQCQYTWKLPLFPSSSVALHSTPKHLASPLSDFHPKTTDRAAEADYGAMPLSRATTTSGSDASVKVNSCPKTVAFANVEKAAALPAQNNNLSRADVVGGSMASEGVPTNQSGNMATEQDTALPFIESIAAATAATAGKHTHIEPCVHHSLPLQAMCGKSDNSEPHRSFLHTGSNPQPTLLTASRDSRETTLHTDQPARVQLLDVPSDKKHRTVHEQCPTSVPLRNSPIQSHPLMMPFGYGNTNPAVSENYFKTFNIRAPSEGVYANTSERGDRIREFRNSISSPTEATTERPKIANPNDALRLYIEARKQVEKLQMAYHSEYRSKYLDWTQSARRSSNIDSIVETEPPSPLSPVLKACSGITDNATGNSGVSKANPYYNLANPAAGLPLGSGVPGVPVKRIRPSLTTKISHPIESGSSEGVIPRDAFSKSLLSENARYFPIEAKPRIIDLTQQRKPTRLQSKTTLNGASLRGQERGGRRCTAASVLPKHHQTNPTQSGRLGSAQVLNSGRSPYQGWSVFDEMMAIKPAGISDAETHMYRERRHYPCPPGPLQVQDDTRTFSQRYGALAGDSNPTHNTDEGALATWGLAKEVLQRAQSRDQQNK
ncbi:hypothetical protein BASA81_017672 [Batrachochytrium salamandrivorans]|nr:hypothetical protein BASA81_017672 [Batrachochytrium salamandrivorans]